MSDFKGAAFNSFGGGGAGREAGRKGKFSEGTRMSQWRTQKVEVVQKGNRKLAQEREQWRRNTGFRYFFVFFQLFTSVNSEVVFCKEVILESCICLEACRYQLK